MKNQTINKNRNTKFRKVDKNDKVRKILRSTK